MEIIIHNYLQEDGWTFYCSFGMDQGQFCIILLIWEHFGGTSDYRWCKVKERDEKNMCRFKIILPLHISLPLVTWHTWSENKETILQESLSFNVVCCRGSLFWTIGLNLAYTNIVQYIMLTCSIIDTLFWLYFMNFWVK